MYFRKICVSLSIMVSCLCFMYCFYYVIHDTNDSLLVCGLLLFYTLLVVLLMMDNNLVGFKSDMYENKKVKSVDVQEFVYMTSIKLDLGASITERLIKEAMDYEEYVDNINKELGEK